MGVIQCDRKGCGKVGNILFFSKVDKYICSECLNEMKEEYNNIVSVDEFDDFMMTSKSRTQTINLSEDYKVK